MTNLLLVEFPEYSWRQGDSILQLFGKEIGGLFQLLLTDQGRVRVISVELTGSTGKLRSSLYLSDPGAYLKPWLPNPPSDPLGGSGDFSRYRPMVDY